MHSCWMQWSDRRYYTALREVQAVGHLASPTLIQQYRRQGASCSLPFSSMLSSDAQESTAFTVSGQMQKLYCAIQQLNHPDDPLDVMPAD